MKAFAGAARLDERKEYKHDYELTSELNFANYFSR